MLHPAPPTPIIATDGLAAFASSEILESSVMKIPPLLVSFL